MSRFLTPRHHRGAHSVTLHRSLGFSLIELMVGLLIGMLAIVVMMQVFSASEGYKRITTGGDDAQNNGAIALYGLQRDLQQSGFGVSAFPVIGCSVLLRAGVTLSSMSPVTVNSAALPASAHDANTDTVTVVYGNANGAGEGELIQAQPATNLYTVAAAAAGGASPGAFVVDDKVIAEPVSRPSPCALAMSPVTAVAAANVSVGAGTAGMSSGTLYNLGKSPRVLAYAVYKGSLTVCDYTVSDCGAAGNVGNATVWVPIASNIVSLRAEYGKDTSTPMDGAVDAFDQTTPADQCHWARVSALRMVVVARSATYDKNDQRPATAAAPTWASAATPIDLSGFANWQHYRYKLFQTVVPLRNMAWQGAQAGC